MPGIISSLYTRVREWTGPRPLSTGTEYGDGMQRQLAIPQGTQTRWLLEDLESAAGAADTGVLRTAGRLNKALRRDGVIHGVGSTRTLGLVQLPVRFRGDEREVAAASEDFREVFPSQELALLAWDLISLGVGLGEFIEVPGAKPVLYRCDPQWIWYRWWEDRWYYQSYHGMIPINPGDGRWVLFLAGKVEPWNNALWYALSRAYIAKEHAYFYRENYNSKLANAARIAEAPQGASQVEFEAWFQKVAAWGVNTVFGLKPGYKASLLESNGVGYQTFTETITTCNEEIIITVAGQSVTTDGGTGFTNASIFENIRSDLIQGDAEVIAAILNVQALPVWADWRFGAEAGHIECAWDVTPPKDLIAQATAMTSAAQGIAQMNESLGAYGQEVDAEEICKRFGVPIRPKTTAAAPGLAPRPSAPTPPPGGTNVRAFRAEASIPAEKDGGAALERWREAA